MSEKKQTRDIVVVGASAGGVETLRELIGALPAGFPAAVLLVLHMPIESSSVLPTIFSRAGNLPALHPVEGQEISPGKVYVAPPGLHMGVRNGKVTLSRGPRENLVRPAIDYLFRAAAAAYGSRVIGVVLSGLLYDGAAGLKAIQQREGLVVVQDPQEALFSSMPLHAIEQVKPDAVLPVHEIARFLHEQAGTAVSLEGGQSMEPETIPIDPKIEKDLNKFRDNEGKDLATLVTCPECGGILWELRDGDLVEYQCYVGHRYLTNSLISAKDDELEDALWTAIRILEERANMLMRLSNNTENRNGHSARRFREQADSAHRSANAIRDLVASTQFDAPEEAQGRETA